MKLKPSMKEKKRYIVLKVDKFKEVSKIEKKIDKFLLKKLSVVEYAETCPIFVISKKRNNFFVILSISHKSLKKIKKILEEKFEVVGVSGTIKKAKKFIK